MKKYIVFINGNDLANYPVTQNEIGVYYRNSSGTYFTTKLDKFDNATLPSGFKKYVNGSHARHISNPTRNPIDFSIVAGSSVTTNFKVRVISHNVSQAWVKCQIVGTNYMIAFVHCYRYPSDGTYIEAGKQICQIAPTSANGGFAVHLHIDEWTGGKIRDLILDGDFNMGGFEVGDRVKFSGTMNIRTGAGTGFKDTGDIVKGAVGQIIDGPRTSQNAQFGHGANDKYTWYDFKFTDLTGWVADTGKMSITTDAITPLDGEKPLTEVEILKEEIEELKIETRALGTQIETLEKQNEELLEANEDLNKYKEYFDKLSVLIETKI